MENKQNKPQQIKIEFNEESSSVEYSNFVVVTHSAAEFVLDFIRVLPGMAKAKVKSRVIMSPMHVKTLMMALQDNIKKFEDKFGEIKIIKKDDSTSPQFNIPDDILPN
tara:strand:+ start:513 stop:836 length:324 start_codon:yes stop_codon:yes gene_type:complete